MGNDCWRDRSNKQDDSGSAATLTVSYLTEAQPISDELPQKINAGEMGKPIHRFIGALIFRKKKNQKILGKGTGILISPNLVLTGAQNVWNRKEK
jgi:hypothetical protein